MSIDGGISTPPGDSGASAIYLPTVGVTSLAGYRQPTPLSAFAMASNTAGSHMHHYRGHTAARHHATHATHHQHKTRSHMHTHKAVADVGLEHQTF